MVANPTDCALQNCMNFSTSTTNASRTAVSNETVEYAIWVEYINIAAEIFIALLVFLSNTLVLMSVAKFAYLRTATHRLIASLAVADLLVALLGIPSAVLLRLGLHMSTDEQLAPNQITVSKDVCLVVIWMVVFITQVSILHLVLIAIDRYIAIKHSLRYYTIVTTRRVKFGIACAWIFGGIIGFTPLLSSENTFEHDEGRCVFEKVASMRYMVYFNFFGCVLIPLICLFIIYGYIFRSATNQLGKIYKHGYTHKHCTHFTPSPGSKSPKNPNQKKYSTASNDCVIFQIHSRSDGIYTFQPNSKGHYGNGTSFIDEYHAKADLSTSTSSTDLGVRFLVTSSSSSPSFHRRISTATDRDLKLRKMSKLLRKELRAARCLFMIVGLFALCWLPIHIHNCLVFFNGTAKNTQVVTDIFVLLSHANSLMNPIVYAFRMREWRKAFQVLLKNTGSRISRTFSAH